MHDPFELGDAVIRDLPHVRVTRHAPRAGRACEYRKLFKPDGLGEAAYWVRRENEFLLDFTVKRLRHTVELATFAQGGEATPVVELVATRDAGVTVEDWLRVQPRHENGVVWLHPFQHAGLFLEWLRACLVALQEIHRLGIVHCDIKEDNICLPYSPYPYAAGQAIRIDFSRVRLIDFAFSVTPERPLLHPLPILPTAPYQSNLLKTALDADRAGSRRRLAAQQLDFRVDLFSLGFLAGRILDVGLLQPAGQGGAAAMDGAYSLVERLQALDSGKWRGKTLPHGELIGDIDHLLEGLTDLDAYRRFELARVRETASVFAAVPAGRETGFGPTPLTPLAAPVLTAPTPLTPPVSMVPTPLAKPLRPRPRRQFPTLLTLAVLAGLGLAGYWWNAVQPPPALPLPNIDAKAKAPLKATTDDAAKARAKQEAQWKQDADTQFQAEEAKQKAEAAARAKAELAAELRAEAEKPAETPEQPATAVEVEQAVEAPGQSATVEEAAKPIEEPRHPSKAASARIEYPVNGNNVERSEAIRGTLEIDDSQHAFLVIRSKAEAYGRLYYPQGELPHAAEWVMKGIFGTPNYEYETFVVVTANPQSVELLRAQKSRAYGLKNLPDDTRMISGIVTVARLQ